MFHSKTSDMEQNDRSIATDLVWGSAYCESNKSKSQLRSLSLFVCVQLSVDEHPRICHQRT